MSALHGMRSARGRLATVAAVTAAGMSLLTRGGVAADSPVDAAVKAQAEAAVQKGVAWLLANQRPDGAWSNTNFPALTALPVWAMARAGQSGTADATRKAVAFITSLAHASGPTRGAIFRHVPNQKGGGMMNYNTAICMAALAALNDPSLNAVILAAREFMAAGQFLGEGVYRGGLGYDANTSRAYTDLSNSTFGYEAMRLTQRIEDLRPAGKRVDLDWAAAQAFIQRCQNDPRVNTQPWASSDTNEVGGFVYHPEQTRAGTYTDKDGIVRFRSMRGMTYAGMLSYVYAGVDRRDPRVKAAFEWASNHWSLEANNPVSGGKASHDTMDEREGLYYLYLAIAKGLNAYGQDEIAVRGGRPIRWRDELCRTLAAKQKADGSWVNDNARYWESDAVLVTAYMLLAVETALGR